MCAFKGGGFVGGPLHRFPRAYNYISAPRVNEQRRAAGAPAAAAAQSYDYFILSCTTHNLEMYVYTHSLSFVAYS